MILSYNKLLALRACSVTKMLPTILTIAVLSATGFCSTVPNVGLMVKRAEDSSFSYNQAPGYYIDLDSTDQFYSQCTLTYSTPAGGPYTGTCQVDGIDVSGEYNGGSVLLHPQGANLNLCDITGPMTFDDGQDQNCGHWNYFMTSGKAKRADLDKRETDWQVCVICKPCSENDGDVNLFSCDTGTQEGGGGEVNWSVNIDQSNTQCSTAFTGGGTYNTDYDPSYVTLENTNGVVSTGSESNLSWDYYTVGGPFCVQASSVIPH